MDITPLQALPPGRAQLGAGSLQLGQWIAYLTSGRPFSSVRLFFAPCLIAAAYILNPLARPQALALPRHPPSVSDGRRDR